MKKIPNYLVNELIRLIPVLIENIPHEGRSTRVDNAIRLTNKIVKRLKSFNTSVNFYREIKSKTIELAKASQKALNRSLKCCQNRMIKHKKKY